MRISLPKSIKMYAVKLAVPLLLIGVGVGAYLAGNAMSQNTIQAQAEELAAPLEAQDSLPEPVSSQSSINDILLLMLRSHEQWKSLKAEGVLRWVKKVDGSTVEVYQQLNVMQQSSHGPFLIRAESGFQSEKMSYRNITDGQTLWSAQLDLNIYTQKPYTPGSRFPPSELPTINDENHPIFPHPVDGSLPSPLTELLFPAGLAQSLALEAKNGKVTILEDDTVAGRPAVILRWDPISSSYQLLWVDAELGILLKRKVFDADEQSPDQQWLEHEQLEITQIQFSETLPSSLFRFNQGHAQFLTADKFSDRSLEEWMRQIGGSK